MKSTEKIISLVILSSLSISMVNCTFAQDKNEKINPALNFKLIGVFQVGGKQKAIIENLNSSTGGRQEYSVGDFLDEMQTISISKIVNSPTVKVEILDNEGGHFLIRPSSIDDGSRPSGSASSSYSGGYKKPSAFANKFKSKQQKINAFTDENQMNAGNEETPDNSVPPPPPDNPPPDTMTPEPDIPEPQADPATQNNSQPGTATSPASTTPPAEDIFGRPSNPFDN